MIIFYPPAKEIALHKKMIADLRRYSKKYYRLFELDRWEVHVHFEAVPVDEQGKPEPIDFESASANCESQPEYYIGTIKYFIQALIEKKRERDLEVYARHEFLHILLSYYTNNASNMCSEIDGSEDASYAATLTMHEERLVSDLEALKLWDRLK